MTEVHSLGYYEDDGRPHRQIEAEDGFDDNREDRLLEQGVAAWHKAIEAWDAKVEAFHEEYGDYADITPALLAIQPHPQDFGLESYWRWK